MRSKPEPVFQWRTQPSTFLPWDISVEDDHIFAMIDGKVVEVTPAQLTTWGFVYAETDASRITRLEWELAYASVQIGRLSGKITELNQVIDGLESEKAWGQKA